MKQLSIIVPIYNTEKYLRKCVDSLLEQDLDDYEILLINDSSPDSSIDIMKEYEEKFPNIIRIFSKENGGLGDTRNFGIPYAKGKYVTFVDSDDYIKENSLNRLCTKMDNEDLDILVYDFVKEYDNVDFIHEQAMEIIDDKHYVLSTPNACNKMFKTSIFQENGVRFPTKIWYEDLAVIPGLVKYTKKIGYIHEGIYYYQFRSQSIMNQVKYNPKMLEMINSINNLSPYLDEYPLELEFLSLHHLFYGSSLRLLPFKKYDELETCLKTHEKNFPNWDKNPYYNAKPKLYKLFCMCLKKRRFLWCRLLMWTRKIISRRKS